MTATVEQLVAETYAAHYIVGAFGYDPAEMFVVIQPAIGESVVGDNSAPGRCVVFKLRRGGREFNLPIAPVSRKDGKRFFREWIAFAERGKRAKSVAELDWMVQASRMWQRRAELLQAMALKGFDLTPMEAFG